MRIINHIIGSDLEMFLQDKNTGEVVSAEGLIKGTKNKPFVFDAANPFFATSLDNVLSEISIPPAKNIEEFIANLKKSIDYVKKTIPKGLDTLHVASATLAHKYLQTKNAKMFGCSVSYSAWLRDVLEPPNPKVDFRSAGFHVHLGYDNPNMDTNEDFVKAFDLFCTVPSLLIDPDERRRKLYGKAGEFRPKPYGCEVRTLSSFFSSSDELMKWVYNGTVNAINYLNGFNEISDGLGERIQQAINENNKNLAKEIIDEYSIVMP